MAETTTVLKTSGMHCQSCAQLIHLSVSDVEGVSGVEVDLEGGTTVVVHDDTLARVDDIIREIERVGYGAEIA